MSLPDDSLLDDEIRAFTNDTVPPMVEARLRAQLADFRAWQSAPGSAGATRGPSGAWTAWWRLGAACAAAVVLIAVAGLLLGPRTSLAEVAKALLERPWVHVRETGADQGEEESWFAPARNVWASRARDAIKYEDYRLQISETYDPKAGAITRVPIVWHSPGREVESLVVALTALLQEGPSSKNALAHFDFLGPEREKMTVLEQRVERLTEAGQARLEYHLTVAKPPSKEPIQLLFRVDVATKLPDLFRIVMQADGKPVTRVARFDYPETGPADLYALGVPRTAQIVDRVPSGDVKRILETLKAGRSRMDNYRAVFVKHIEGMDYAWWLDQPTIYYRKGMMFRSDFRCYVMDDRGARRRRSEGEDLRKFWLERTKCFQFLPMYVVRGQTTFTSELKAVTDRDGTQHQEIASVLRTVSGNDPDLDEVYPPDWSMRPEFACRPPLGVGHPDLELLLDMHPADGPAGCILLRVRHTSTKDRVNEKGIGTADLGRYWLDPQRDYIVMRWDMVMLEATGKETIIESDITEETARSPEGVWYATKIRRRSVGRDPKDKSLDEVYHLYVDFHSELSDALFEPPSPGRAR